MNTGHKIYWFESGVLLFDLFKKKPFASRALPTEPTAIKNSNPILDLPYMLSMNLAFQYFFLLLGQKHCSDVVRQKGWVHVHNSWLISAITENSILAMGLMHLHWEQLKWVLALFNWKSTGANLHANDGVNEEQHHNEQCNVWQCLHKHKIPCTSLQNSNSF